MKTSILLILGAMLGCALAQAPGDHFSFCRTGRDFTAAHDFPAEWEVLVDTYDYFDLYAPFTGVWRSTSQDNDASQFLQNTGGLCQWSIRSCTRLPAQNNWLFSQYVRYTEAREVYINMSYSFIPCSSCDDNAFTLNRFDVNGQVGAFEQANTRSYQPMFGTKEQSRVSGIGRETRNFVRPAAKEGFYLGIHDAGACGQIDRIIAYYTVCRARQVGLVKYPQVAHPPRSGPDMTFSAECVPNAHSVTSLDVVALSASSTCRDVAPGGARCECNAGYSMSANGTACIRCEAGEFRALGSGPACLPCPANTRTDEVAAAQCQCLPGMFRSTSEGPEAACSAPPTEARELKVVMSDSSNVLVSWKRPTTAGNDLFYEVLISDALSITALKTQVEGSLKDDRETVDYLVTGLKPFTNYVITVVTHNAVSNLDAANSDRRIAQIVAKTTEGVPGPPSLNRLCTVLIWKPPVDPAGVITGYQIRFGQSPVTVETFGASENFYITTGEQRTANALVEIRALNSFAASEWTEALPIDCSSFTGGCLTPSPPTNPPSPSPPPEPLIISVIPCPPLAPPTNGDVSVDERQATYSCDQGFALSGAPSRTCLEDGSWMGVAPTCVATCTSQPLYFMLKGVRYEDGSTIPLTELGEDEDALLAITGYEDCCRNGASRLGNFYYPDETEVPNNNAGQAMYRNRDDQLIRLHRRAQSNAASIPRGRYSAQLPNDCGEMVSIYVNLV